MEMSPGEVFDRFTILWMKAQYSVEMVPERDRYWEEVKTMMNRVGYDKILPYLLTLMEVNSKIWCLESAIRTGGGKEGEKLGMEEVGVRALAIRDENRTRIEMKKNIDKLFNVVPDVKVDHASGTQPVVAAFRPIDEAAAPWKRGIYP